MRTKDSRTVLRGLGGSNAPRLPGGLKRKQEVYQAEGRSITAMELHRELNQLKQTDLPGCTRSRRRPLKRPCAISIKRMRTFSAGCNSKKRANGKARLGYPTFKTKRQGLGSFRLTGSIHVYEKAIELPRLGRLRLKECGYLPTSGVNILAATISEEAGRWFVSVQVEEEVPDPPAATGEPSGQMWGSIGWHSAPMVEWWRIPKPCVPNSNASNVCIVVFHAKRKAVRIAPKPAESSAPQVRPHRPCPSRCPTQGYQPAHPCRLSPEERAARQAEIAASLPEPKAKVKPRKGKKTQPAETPSLPEQMARKIKKKQMKQRLRQANSQCACASGSGRAGRPQCGWHEAEPQAGPLHQ